MIWKRKQAPAAAAATSQLRRAGDHPFGALRGFVPLGTGEERVYRELREAIPLLDAAIEKLVRLTGGFTVKCPDPAVQARLAAFLRSVPSGNGQIGIDSFLESYLDSLLTYGRAVGEILVAGEKVRAVCWGDVTQLQVRQGGNPLSWSFGGPIPAGCFGPCPTPSCCSLPPICRSPPTPTA